MKKLYISDMNYIKIWDIIMYTYNITYILQIKKKKFTINI